MSQDNNHYLTPDQLRIGIYVHLDLPWMDHPFTFNNFLIKTESQLAKVKAMGLQQIRYSPSRSTGRALSSPPDTATSTPADSQEDTEGEADGPILARKQERLAQQDLRQKAILACEKAFRASAEVVRSLETHLGLPTQSPNSTQQADALVTQMLDSLLTDKEIALHLIQDRHGQGELYFHALNTTVMALIVAKELCLSRTEIHTLGLASLFHDVGKRKVPAELLSKTGLLTHAEQTQLEQHCRWGMEIAEQAHLPDDAILLIGQHHELSNGSGYPNRLKNEAIHPLARVLALVNIFDNLCNPMNPLQALTPHEALAQMFALQRAQLDPLVLSTFIRCLGIYPPGSFVLLSSGDYATVVAVNTSHPLKPQVMIYEHGILAQEEPIIIALEEERDINISKSLKPNQLPQAVLAFLNPRSHLTYYFNPSELS